MGTRAQVLIVEASPERVETAAEELRARGDVFGRFETFACDSLARPFCAVFAGEGPLAVGPDTIDAAERDLLERYGYETDAGLAQVALARELTSEGGEAHLLWCTDMSCASMAALIRDGELRELDCTNTNDEDGVRARWRRGDTREARAPFGEAGRYWDAVTDGIARLRERIGRPGSDGEPVPYDFDHLLDIIHGADPD